MNKQFLKSLNSYYKNRNNVNQMLKTKGKVV